MSVPDVDEEGENNDFWGSFCECCRKLRIKWDRPRFFYGEPTWIDKFSVPELVSKLETAMGKVDFVDAVLYMEEESLPIHLVSSIRNSPLMKVIRHPLSPSPHVVLTASNGVVADLFADNEELFISYLATTKNLHLESQNFVTEKILAMEPEKLEKNFRNAVIPDWLVFTLLDCEGNGYSRHFSSSLRRLLGKRKRLRKLALSKTIDAINSGTSVTFLRRNPTLSDVLEIMRPVRGGDLRRFLKLLASHPQPDRFAWDAGFFIQELGAEAVPSFNVLIPLAFSNPRLALIEAVIKFGSAEDVQLAFHTVQSSASSCRSTKLAIYRVIVEGISFLKTK